MPEGPCDEGSGSFCSINEVDPSASFGWCRRPFTTSGSSDLPLSSPGESVTTRSPRSLSFFSYDRVLGLLNFSGAISGVVPTCVITAFGVGPSIFAELPPDLLFGRLFCFEIDAHVCLKTRINGVSIVWRSILFS